MGALARLFVRLSLDASSFISSITGLIGRATGFGQQLGSALAVGAVAASVAGFAALGTAFVGSVQAAGNFEAQMSQVQASLGATREEMAPLSDLARNLALDPGLSVGANDAAASFELLARNGVNAEDILGGVGRASIALTNSTVGANATIGDFATTADVMTDAMALYGKEASQAESVTDSITGVINNSKFAIGTYQTALAGASRATVGLGVGLEDTNTALALISPAFGDAGSAGTSLSRLLTNITAPTKAARKAMNELGISAIDTEGNFVGLPNLFDQLQTSFDGLSEGEVAQFGKDIAGSFGAQALTGILKATDSFEDLSEKVNESGLAQQTAATRVSNFKGAMNLLRDTVQGVAITFGLPFLDPLQNGLRTVAGLVGQFQPQIEAFAQTAASTVSSIFEGFQADGLSGVFDALDLPPGVMETIASVTQGIQNFASFVINNKDAIIGALTGIGIALGVLVGIGAIAGVVSTLALLLNPITAIIALAGLLGAAWAGNWFGIQERVAQAWAIIQPIFASLMVFMQNLLAQFMQSGAFETISSIFTQIGAALGIFFTALQAGQGPFAAFQLALSSVFGEGAAAGFTRVVEIFNQVKAAIFETFGPIITSLIESFRLAWVNLQPAFAQLLVIIQNVALIVGTVLAVAITAIIALIAGLLNGIASALPFITSAITNVVSFISGVVQLVVSIFQLIIAWISGDSSAFATAATAIGESFSLILSSLAEFATNALAALTTLLAGFLEGALTFISDLWTQVTGESTAGLDNFIASLAVFKTNATAFFNETIAAIKKVFTDVDWPGVGKSIIDGIKGGIIAAKDALVGSIRSVATSAVSAFKAAIGANSPATEFIPSGQDIVGGIIYGVDSMRSNLDTSISSLNNDMQSGIEDLEADIQLSVNDIQAQIETAKVLNDRTANTRKSDRIFNLEEGSIQLNVNQTELSQMDSTSELLISQLEDSLL